MATTKFNQITDEEARKESAKKNKTKRKKERCVKGRKKDVYTRILFWERSRANVFGSSFSKVLSAFLKKM